MIARVLAMVICAFLCGPAMPASAQAANPPAVEVEVQQATIDDPGHPPIRATIWSPPAGPARPIIVISHGTGGYVDSHADTARALAESGFVVVALMHPGDNYRDDSEVGRPEWLVDRSRHVSKAIDFMFSRWAGRALLVPNRVGVFGFSAGATTALISIGGEPDLDRVPVHCAEHPEFACSIMVQRPAAGGDARPHWVHDRRIAAAVAAAPGLGFAFAPSGLAHVSVPVQLWSGEADQIVPYATNTGVVRDLLPRAHEFHSVPGAAHYSFLAPCKPATPSQFCQDSEGFDRLAFHRMFNQSVADFFHRHLAEPVQVQQR